MEETKQRAETERSDASPCCGETAATPCCDKAADTKAAVLTDDTPAEDIHRLVREKYGEIASAGSSCCWDTRTVGDPEALGYTAEQTRSIPEGANLGLGCGNPLAHAGLHVGETVLDLGSGAGIDAFLAAREVGPRGRVLGVDMTPAMLEKARHNAQRAGITNVEFRLGEIEHLPVADASVDVVISNCVINLSPDKPQVFREAFRVLRPGGRLVVSDLALVRPLPPAVRGSVEAYVGCIAGASLRDDYLQDLRDAGFAQVEVVQEGRYAGCDTALPGELHAAADAVVSIKVRATKR